MTLYEVWTVSPQSHVFVRGLKKNGQELWEYHGGKEHGDLTVVSMRGTKYPNMSSVIEVEVEA